MSLGFGMAGCSYRPEAQKMRITVGQPDLNFNMQDDTIYDDYHTISYNIIQYHTISYNIIQYHTISYNIIQYHMHNLM